MPYKIISVHLDADQAILMVCKTGASPAWFSFAENRCQANTTSRIASCAVAVKGQKLGSPVGPGSTLETSSLPS